LKKLWIALLLTLGALTSQAHGGEDHGTPAAPAPAAGQLPRATAQTDLFELVALLSPTGAPPSVASGSGAGMPVLTLYLDRFATNEPVDGATIELESGTFKGIATRRSAGVYALPGQAFAAPGRYPFTVSVQTADAADLLDGTLQNEAVAAPPTATISPFAGRTFWAGSAIVIMAGSLWIWMRRKSNQKTSRELLA